MAAAPGALEGAAAAASWCKLTGNTAAVAAYQNSDWQQHQQQHWLCAATCTASAQDAAQGALAAVGGAAVRQVWQLHLHTAQLAAGVWPSRQAEQLHLHLKQQVRRCCWPKLAACESVAGASSSRLGTFEEPQRVLRITLCRRRPQLIKLLGRSTVALCVCQPAVAATCASPVVGSVATHHFGSSSSSSRSIKLLVVASCALCGPACQRVCLHWQRACAGGSCSSSSNLQVQRCCSSSSSSSRRSRQP